MRQSSLVGPSHVAHSVIEHWVHVTAGLVALLYHPSLHSHVPVPDGVALVSRHKVQNVGLVQYYQGATHTAHVTAVVPSES